MNVILWVSELKKALLELKSFMKLFNLLMTFVHLMKEKNFKSYTKKLPERTEHTGSYATFVGLIITINNGKYKLSCIINVTAFLFCIICMLNFHSNIASCFFMELYHCLHSIMFFMELYHLLLL